MASWLYAIAGGPLGASGTTPYRYPASAFPLTYKVDQGALGAFSATTARGIADYAFQRWGAVASANLSFSNGGQLARNVTSANDAYISGTTQFSDGVNPVIFDSSGAITDGKLGIGAKSSVLGFAASAVSAGNYTEGFVIINGYLSGSGTTYDQDVYKAVITHEVGHFLGLSHSQISMHGEFPTMYPTAIDTAMKTLAPDDTLALTRLYPVSGWASGVGTISGTVRRPSGTNLSGVNVIAVDSASGTAYSTVVDYFSGTDTYFTNKPTASGGYSLSGLSPGTYFVRIEPINSGFSGGSSVASYSTPTNTSVAREWYNGASEGGDMLTDNTNDKVGVRVTANSTTSGINITSNESTTLGSITNDNGSPLSLFLLPSSAMTRYAVKFNAPSNGSLLGVKFRLDAANSRLPLNGTLTITVHANAAGSLAGVPGTALGSVTIPFSDLATDQVNEIWLRGLGTAVNFNGGDSFHVSFQTNGVGALGFFSDNGSPTANRSSYYTTANGWRNFPQGFANGTPGYNLMVTAVYSSSVSGNPQPAVTVAPASLDFGRVRPGSTVDTTITISNSGTATLNVAGTAILGRDSASYGITRNGGGFSLTAGSSRTLTLRFAPTNAGGSKSATLSIASNAATSPNTVPLVGMAVAPTASKLLPSISFGQRRTGGTYNVAFALLRNTGNDTLHITGTSLTGADAGVGLILLSRASAMILPPDSTDTVVVSFLPLQRRTYNATLTIAHDDTSGSTSFAVAGTGIAPVFATVADTLSIGNVRVGTTASAPPYYIGNAGDAPMTVTRIAVVGADSANISVASPTTFPLIIAPGDSAAVQLRFAPDQRRAYQVKLRVTHDAAGGPTDRIVTGRGIAPVLVAPAASAIGSVRVASSIDGAVTLQNTGDAPLAIAGVEITGTNASEFTLVSPTAFPVQVPAGAGGSLPLQVRFHPNGPGLRTATMKITSDDPALPTREVQLAETGLQGVLSPQSGTVDFGDVLVTSSQVATLGLTNTGTDTLTISSAKVTGGEFSIEGADPAGIRIAPEMTAQLHVKFLPTTTGIRSGLLTIATDASIVPVTTVLTGRGVAAGLAVSRSAIDFGTLGSGTGALDSFVVRNSGSLPLADVTVQLGGPSAAAFTIDAPTTPFSLGVGEARTVHVTLKPQSASAQLAATVQVREGSGETRQVDLTARIVTGTLAFPATIDFGTHAAASFPRDTTITLWNQGASQLHLLAATTTGKRSDGATGEFFRVTSRSIPIDLGPTSGLQVTIRFDPFVLGDASSARDFTGTLTIQELTQSWTIDLLGSVEAPVSAVRSGAVAAGGMSLAIDVVMPNPAAGRAEVRLTVDGVGRIPAAIYVVDPLGNRVAEAFDGTIEGSGARAERRFVIDVTGLSSGAYRVLLVTGNGTISRPLVVVR